MSTIIKQSVNRVSIRLRECNSKRQIFITLNDEDVLLCSHQTISMKHHFTETHKQACKIRNIVSALQSIVTGKYDQLHHVIPLSEWYFPDQSQTNTR